jgi:hypothetical protein
MPHPNGMPTHAELRSMPDEELVKSIDRQYSLTPDARHLLLAQCFRDELIRREHEQSTTAMLGCTSQMHELTKQIRNLTIVILMATMLTLAATAFSVVVHP